MGQTSALSRSAFPCPHFDQVEDDCTTEPYGEHDCWLRRIPLQEYRHRHDARRQDSKGDAGCASAEPFAPRHEVSVLISIGHLRFSAHGPVHHACPAHVQYTQIPRPA